MKFSVVYLLILQHILMTEIFSANYQRYNVDTAGIEREHAAMVEEFNRIDQEEEQSEGLIPFDVFLDEEESIQDRLTTIKITHPWLSEHLPAALDEGSPAEKAKSKKFLFALEGALDTWAKIAVAQHPDPEVLAKKQLMQQTLISILNPLSEDTPTRLKALIKKAKKFLFIVNGLNRLAKIKDNAIAFKNSNDSLADKVLVFCFCVEENLKSALRGTAPVKSFAEVIDDTKSMADSLLLDVHNESAELREFVITLFEDLLKLLLPQSEEFSFVLPVKDPTTNKDLVKKLEAMLKIPTTGAKSLQDLTFVLALFKHLLQCDEFINNPLEFDSKLRTEIANILQKHNCLEDAVSMVHQYAGLPETILANQGMKQVSKYTQAYNQFRLVAGKSKPDALRKLGEMCMHAQGAIHYFRRAKGMDSDFVNLWISYLPEIISRQNAIRTAFWSYQSVSSMVLQSPIIPSDKKELLRVLLEDSDYQRGCELFHQHIALITQLLGVTDYSNFYRPLYGQPRPLPDLKRLLIDEGFILIVDNELEHSFQGKPGQHIWYHKDNRLVVRVKANGTFSVGFTTLDTHSLNQADIADQLVYHGKTVEFAKVAKLDLLGNGKEIIFIVPPFNCELMGSSKFDPFNRALTGNNTKGAEILDSAHFLWRK